MVRAIVVLMILWQLIIMIMILRVPKYMKLRKGQLHKLKLST